VKIVRKLGAVLSQNLLGLQVLLLVAAGYFGE
jgi:hypothetical protein